MQREIRGGEVSHQQHVALYLDIFATSIDQQLNEPSANVSLARCDEGHLAGDCLRYHYIAASDG